jgi:hypothetical protein
MSDRHTSPALPTRPLKWTAGERYASVQPMLTCAFTGLVLIDPDMTDPEEGCEPMSTSTVFLLPEHCPLSDDPKEYSGHPVCLPHLKQFHEEDWVEHEEVG